jgi:hypothetical protein
MALLRRAISGDVPSLRRWAPHAMAVSSAFCRPEEDPFLLLQSTQRAIEAILRRHRGQPLRRSWIEVPYGEEELTRLEEEVLPAIAACLARIDAIDAELEAKQVACQLPGWAEVAVA